MSDFRFFHSEFLQNAVFIKSFNIWASKSKKIDFFYSEKNRIRQHSLRTCCAIMIFTKLEYANFNTQTRCKQKSSAYKHSASIKSPFNYIFMSILVPVFKIVCKGLARVGSVPSEIFKCLCERIRYFLWFWLLKCSFFYKTVEKDFQNTATLPWGISQYSENQQVLFSSKPN